MQFVLVTSCGVGGFNVNVSVNIYTNINMDLDVCQRRFTYWELSLLEFDTFLQELGEVSIQHPLLHLFVSSSRCLNSKFDALIDQSTNQLSDQLIVPSFDELHSID